MKLRIKGNSLRLRVTPSELTRLLEAGRIEETISFAPDPDARLTYAVERSGDAHALTVRAMPGMVTVIVPSAAARQWSGGQDVGLYGEAPAYGGPLQIAVEKDFACLDKTDADNMDTFPNPNKDGPC